MWKEKYQKLLYGYFFILGITAIGFDIDFFPGNNSFLIFLSIILVLSGIAFIFEIITIYYALKRSKTEKGVVGPTMKRMTLLLSIATLASFVQYLYVDIIYILRQEIIPDNEITYASMIILLDIVPVGVILITFYRIPPTRKSEVIVRGTEVQKPLLEKNDTENATESIHTESPRTKKVEKKGKKIENFNL